jgi:hypothetical protein
MGNAIGTVAPLSPHVWGLIELLMNDEPAACVEHVGGLAQPSNLASSPTIPLLSIIIISIMHTGDVPHMISLHHTDVI